MPEPTTFLVFAGAAGYMKFNRTAKRLCTDHPGVNRPFAPHNRARAPYPPYADQPDGVRAGRAGRLEILQRPGTSKGVALATLENETGLATLILYPKTFEAYRGVFRSASAL